jgi:hypothetical protein
MESFFVSVIGFSIGNWMTLLTLLAFLITLYVCHQKYKDSLHNVCHQKNKDSLHNMEKNICGTGVMPNLAEGRAFHNIPSNMDRSKPYSVSVSLSPTWNSKIYERMLGDGTLQSKKIKLSEYMEVWVDGVGFNIVDSSSKEQLIADGAIWNFNITPLQSGAHKLHICITIKTQLDGKESSKDMEPVIWDVNVNIGSYTVGAYSHASRSPNTL